MSGVPAPSSPYKGLAAFEDSAVDALLFFGRDRDSQVIAARLMQICGQVAWPVDANLRPEGSQGPLARTLAAHQAYYARWARTESFVERNS